MRNRQENPEATPWITLAAIVGVGGVLVFAMRSRTSSVDVAPAEDYVEEEGGVVAAVLDALKPKSGGVPAGEPKGAAGYISNTPGMAGVPSYPNMRY